MKVKMFVFRGSGRAGGCVLVTAYTLPEAQRLLAGSMFADCAHSDPSLKYSLAVGSKAGTVEGFIYKPIIG